MSVIPLLPDTTAGWFFVISNSMLLIILGSGIKVLHDIEKEL